MSSLNVSFPEIGPVNVSGLSFAEGRATINDRVTHQMIGVGAGVTLGELRSIQVFVLGEVVRPGSYTVSGLSTVANALFASRGVKTIGSLRNIAVRRDGNTIATLDLYALLLHTSAAHAPQEFGTIPWSTRDIWPGNLLPDGPASGKTIEVLRNMLVRESGNDLYLFSAVSPAWLKAGKTLEVVDQPRQGSKV